MNVSASSYSYGNTEAGHHHSYLVPTVLRLLHKERPASGRRLIDLGCGNGSLTAVFHQNGWSAVGIDPSLEGIANARQGFPDVTFEVGSAYDNLADRLGTFPVLASLEVVEHIYAPRLFAKTVYDLLEPGGLAIISTPYHSYLKNLSLAISGHLDAHFTTLWDHGHIKFWSVKTLSELLSEAGLLIEGISRVGRVPIFAKSMIIAARKPCP